MGPRSSPQWIREAFMHLLEELITSEAKPLNTHTASMRMAGVLFMAAALCSEE